MLKAHFHPGIRQALSQPFPAEIAITAQDGEEIIMADAKVASNPSSFDSDSQQNDKDICIAKAICLNEALNEAKSETYFYDSSVLTSLELEHIDSIYQLSSGNHVDPSIDNSHFV